MNLLREGDWSSRTYLQPLIYRIVTNSLYRTAYFHTHKVLIQVESREL